MVTNKIDLQPLSKPTEDYTILNNLGEPKVLEYLVDPTEDEKSDEDSIHKIPTPRQFKKLIDKRVWGQDDAKKAIALAIQNIGHRMNYPDLEIPKSNVLIAGPTGCGKTLLIDSIVDIAKVPVAKMKMSGVSAEGFVGPSITDVFFQLTTYNDEDHDGVTSRLENERLIDGYKPNSEFAIIYLDEIDKLAKSDGSFGLQLQDELIGYLENTLVEDISTKNMLFIGTGAFVGLDKIIYERISGTKSIGFGSAHVKKMPDNILSYASTEDYIKFGFKPELAGRFTNRSYMNELSVDQLTAILDMEDSYLSKKRKLLKITSGLTLRIPRAAKETIAKYAKLQQTNARGLQATVDKLLAPIFSDEGLYKNKTIVLTNSLVSDRLYLDN